MFRHMKVVMPSMSIAILALVILTLFNGDDIAYLADNTATAIPFPTMSLLLTPSPTPFLIQDSTPDNRCVPASDEANLSPGEAVDALFHHLDAEPLLDFFNSGGTPESLRATLDTLGNEVGPYFAPYFSQVVEQDITGDTFPEIFLAVTAAIVTTRNGESHLVMFQCVEGAYQEMILFRRAGAGSRSEGLYTGGGAHILSIADLNANGAMDMIFVVDWSDEYGEYAEYYMIEWQDGDFYSIVESQNFLDETIGYIQSNTRGDFRLTDPEEDGVYELVIDDIVYRWDGERYREGEQAD
jgi:hypothetical protein